MSSYLRTFLAFLLASLGGGLVYSRPEPVVGGAQLKVFADYIEFPGVLYPETYARLPDRYAGHNAITYEGGGSAYRALIRTPVPDRNIAAALAGLGIDAKGGLHEASWSRRFDPDAPEPDQRPEGDRLEVMVRWGHGSWMPLQDLLRDHGEPAALDLRFQDNRRWISLYRSGCVVCLSSCPGAKIGNRTYTMRQNEFGPMDYTPRKKELPADETPVLIRMGRAGGAWKQ
jgi:hypothetical protein